MKLGLGTPSDSQFRRALIAAAQSEEPGSDSKLRAWDALQEAKKIADRHSGKYAIVRPK